jgi:hypothetical protein
LLPIIGQSLANQHAAIISSMLYNTEFFNRIGQKPPLGDSIKWPGLMGSNHTANIGSLHAQEQAPPLGEPANATFWVRIVVNATKGSKGTISPAPTNSATPFQFADFISQHDAFALEQIEHTLRVSGNTEVLALLR